MAWIFPPNLGQRANRWLIKLDAAGNFISGMGWNGMDKKSLVLEMIESFDKQAEGIYPQVVVQQVADLWVAQWARIKDCRNGFYYF